MAFHALTKNEIRAFKLLPSMVSEISEKLNISIAGASKTVSRMVENGLAYKKREGKKIVIQRGETIHAKKLGEAIIKFPRIPVEDVLSHSNLAIIVFLRSPLSVSDLGALLGTTRQWASKSVRFLAGFGILLKTEHGYIRNPIHASISEFADAYCSFVNHKVAPRMASDAIIIWEMGFEFMFITRKDLDLQRTATAAFPDYGLPMLGDIKYYYYSKRKIDAADVLMHTILVSPESAMQNMYACLFYEKTHPAGLEKKARLHSLASNIEKLVRFVKSGGEFIVSREDYDALRKEYGFDENVR